MILKYTFKNSFFFDGELIPLLNRGESAGGFDLALFSFFPSWYWLINRVALEFVVVQNELTSCFTLWSYVFPLRNIGSYFYVRAFICCRNKFKTIFWKAENYGSVFISLYKLFKRFWTYFNPFILKMELSFETGNFLTAFVLFFVVLSNYCW